MPIQHAKMRQRIPLTEGGDATGPLRSENLPVDVIGELSICTQSLDRPINHVGKREATCRVSFRQVGQPRIQNRVGCRIANFAVHLAQTVVPKHPSPGILVLCEPVEQRPDPFRTPITR
jgi:hypothetical protein